MTHRKGTEIDRYLDDQSLTFLNIEEGRGRRAAQRRVKRIIRLCSNGFLENECGLRATLDQVWSFLDMLRDGWLAGWLVNELLGLRTVKTIARKDKGLFAVTMK